MKRHIEGDTMYEVDFSKPIHIHFIGIGGISMSGLAEILLKESFTISGSDAKESDLTRHLTSLGAQVFYGQKAETFFREPTLLFIPQPSIRTIRNLPLQKLPVFRC